MSSLRLLVIENTDWIPAFVDIRLYRLRSTDRTVYIRCTYIGERKRKVFFFISNLPMAFPLRERRAIIRILFEQGIVDIYQMRQKICVKKQMK